MKGELKRDFLDLKDIVSITAILEGGIGILVPLYMFYLGINLGQAGVILAISPLVYGFSRLISSVLSDVEGVKHFLIIQSISYALIPLVIAVSPNIYGFSIAMILSGISRGTIWAVLRPAALKFKRKVESTSEVIGIRYKYLGIGRFISLIFSSIVGFYLSFLTLFFLGIKAILSAIDIREKFGHPTKAKIRKEIFFVSKKRKKEFYFSSLVIGLSLAIILTFTGLILPYVLEKILLLNLVEIAIVVGISYVVSGFVISKLNHFNDSYKILLLSFLSFAIGTYLISMSNLYVYLGASLLGVGIAIAIRHNEALIVKYAEKEDRALSISLLTIPGSLMQTLLYSTSASFIKFMGIYNFMYLLSLVLFLALLAGHKIHAIKDKAKE